jgi:hypothetical protein
MADGMCTFVLRAIKSAGARPVHEMECAEGCHETLTLFEVRDPKSIFQ